jgi:hypothetical protein
MINKDREIKALVGMHRREYEKFAKMFGKKLANTLFKQVVWELVDDACRIFAEDNVLFDKEKFIEKVKLHIILESK